MKHPIKGSSVRLISLESGHTEYRRYLGRIGEVISCDRYGTRRFYGVRFKDDIAYLYRPEIEIEEKQEKKDE